MGLTAKTLFVFIHHDRAETGLGSHALHNGLSNVRSMLYVGRYASVKGAEQSGLFVKVQRLGLRLELVSLRRNAQQHCCVAVSPRRKYVTLQRSPRYVPLPPSGKLTMGRPAQLEPEAYPFRSTPTSGPYCHPSPTSPP